jgi:hypothetical protein
MATIDFSLSGSEMQSNKIDRDESRQKDSLLNISQAYLSGNDETLESFSIDLFDDESAFDHSLAKLDTHIAKEQSTSKTFKTGRR